MLLKLAGSRSRDVGAASRFFCCILSLLAIVDGVGLFALSDIHGRKGKQKCGKTTALKGLVEKE